MTNPQHIEGLAAGQIGWLRELPLDDREISAETRAILDDMYDQFVGRSIDGHWFRLKAADILIATVKAHTATAVQEERTRVESRIVHAITDLDVLKDDLIENTNEDDASPSLVERVRDIADDLRRATPQDQSGSAGE